MIEAAKAALNNPNFVQKCTHNLFWQDMIVWMIWLCPLIGLPDPSLAIVASHWSSCPLIGYHYHTL